MKFLLTQTGPPDGGPHDQLRVQGVTPVVEYWTRHLHTGILVQANL